MIQVNTGTPLAMLYNDRSVLENYHSMAFFHILHTQPKLGKLTLNYHRPDLQWFRKLVVHCILMTDMSLHDDFVHSIEEQSMRIHTTDLQNEVVANTEREIICGAIIKCADIGNCVSQISFVCETRLYLIRARLVAAISVSKALGL